MCKISWTRLKMLPAIRYHAFLVLSESYVTGPRKSSLCVHELKSIILRCTHALSSHRLGIHWQQMAKHTADFWSCELWDCWWALINNYGSVIWDSCDCYSSLNPKMAAAVCYSKQTSGSYGLNLICWLFVMILFRSNQKVQNSCMSQEMLLDSCVQTTTKKLIIF